MLKITYSWYKHKLVNDNLAMLMCLDIHDVEDQQHNLKTWLKQGDRFDSLIHRNDEGNIDEAKCY